MTNAHFDDNGASEQYEPDYSWLDLRTRYEIPEPESDRRKFYVIAGFGSAFTIVCLVVAGWL